MIFQTASTFWESYVEYISTILLPPPNSPFPNGLGKKNNEIKKGCFVSNIFMFRNIII